MWKPNPLTEFPRRKGKKFKASLLQGERFSRSPEKSAAGGGQTKVITRTYCRLGTLTVLNCGITMRSGKLGNLRFEQMLVV
ncbi:MAG: hypothetical protein C4323_17740 [Mastigocladus sp. ERB_26_2]|mgnify:CR=1 FL=1